MSEHEAKEERNEDIKVSFEGSETEQTNQSEIIDSRIEETNKVEVEVEGVEPEKVEAKDEIPKREDKVKPSVSKINKLFKRDTSEGHPKGKSFNDFYDRNYKKFMILPFALLVASITLIIFQVVTTGDYIHRDVTLKGGVTITIPLDKEVDLAQLQKSLSLDFPKNDISARSLKRGGQDFGLTVSVDIDGNNNADVNRLLASIEKNLNIDLTKLDYTTEIVGSSLGTSFFREIFKVLIISFILMSIVVFIAFRVPIPCFAAILSVFADITSTLAVVNLIGIKLSTAGIAAFLMLIGYSVDTDMLLSTKVLKKKEGTLNKRIFIAFTTGMTMTGTTIVAVVVALIFTNSDVIRQIMTIVFIGLIFDIINTWITNAGLLKWYMERKVKND